MHLFQAMIIIVLSLFFNDAFYRVIVKILDFNTLAIEDRQIVCALRKESLTLIKIIFVHNTDEYFFT